MSLPTNRLPLHCADTAPGKRVTVAMADAATTASAITCTARLPDGSELRFRVRKELFHCGELLFRPELSAGSGE